MYELPLHAEHRKGVNVKRVIYCTAVHNRRANFQIMLHSFLQLRSLPQNARDMLCVYDWDGALNDINEIDGVAYAAGAETGPINRAESRNRAFAILNKSPDDLVFFVDCDMVLPADFSDRVRRFVKPGHVYFPVCYSLYKNAPMVVKGSGPDHYPGQSGANGWWREAGRGNCGFVVRDFMALGGWDGAKFGTNYGREDDDVFWRAKARFTVHREWTQNFFHQWHPRGTEPQNPSVKR